MTFRNYGILGVISSCLVSFSLYSITQLSVNGTLSLNKRAPYTYSNPAERIEARKALSSEPSLIRSAAELSDTIARDLGVVLQAENKDELLDKARYVGQNYKLPFWRNLWAHLVDQHEIISEGTPLHKACHLIKKDLESLQKMSKRLYKRGFATHDIFFEIQEQITSLQEIISTIKSTKDFVEESRDSQAHYDQQAQLRETKRQTEELKNLRRETEELKKIANKPIHQSTYVVIKKEPKRYC